MLETTETFFRQLKEVAEQYNNSVGCCSCLFSNSELAKKMDRIITLVDAVLDKVEAFRRITNTCELTVPQEMLDESASTNLSAIDKIMDPDFFKALGNDRVEDRFRGLSDQITPHLLDLIRHERGAPIKWTTAQTQ